MGVVRTVVSVLLIAAPIGGLVATPPASPRAAADDGGSIRGTVVLRDGRRHEGPIRWGDRQRFWDERLAGVLAEDLELGERTEHLEVFGLRVWQWKERDVVRLSIAVPFGLIASIERTGGDALTATLVDGTVVDMRRSGRDVGADPTVETGAGDPVTPDWGDVERVEFAAGPATGAERSRLYGTVETAIGRWTGFVAWDRDERVLDETLDGDEAEIPFARIAEIHKDGPWAATVVLRDGTVEKLSGTNDVNEDNRGIEIRADGLGTVVVGWDAFTSFVLDDPPPSPARGTFAAGPLRGTVVTRAGERLAGTITWGDHERWVWETLDGELHPDVDVAIPFSELAGVVPSPDDPGWATVELRSGRELEVRGGDVEAEARPLEVGTGAGPRRVEWADVAAVELEPAS